MLQDSMFSQIYGQEHSVINSGWGQKEDSRRRWTLGQPEGWAQFEGCGVPDACPEDQGQFLQRFCAENEQNMLKFSNRGCVSASRVGILGRTDGA